MGSFKNLFYWIKNKINMVGQNAKEIFGHFFNL